MSQSATTSWKGLVTQPNEFGVAEGALVTADNVVISSDDVVESRRGMEANTLGTFGSGSSRMAAFSTYQSVVLGAYGATIAHWDTSGSPTITAFGGQYGTPATGMPNVLANRNWYVSADGVFKLDSAAGNIYLAGAPKGRDLQVSLSGTSGFLPGNTETCYRVVWGYRDANSNLLLGAPSQRATLTHPNATAAIGGAVRAANVVTVTTSAAHGFVTGMNVVLSPTDGTFTAGTYGPITVTGSTTFTYAQVAANATSAAALTFTPVGRNVQVVITIPQELYTRSSGAFPAATGTPTHFYQVYRSRQSADQNTTPDDEMALVYEGSMPASAAITGCNRAGTTVTVTTSAAHGFFIGQWVAITPGNAYLASATYKVATTPTALTFTIEVAGTAGADALARTAYPATLSYTDVIPDSLRQAALYTNPGQEGILQSNERPPTPADMALFKGSVFYANALGRNRLKLTLMSVDSSSGGFAAGDTITFTTTAGSFTLTGQAAEDITNDTFQIYTSGTAAQNIANTVASLVRVLNISSHNGGVGALDGYILSGPNDMPGIMSFENRWETGSGITGVTVSAHGGAWQPALPTSGTSIAGTSEGGVSTLYYSKQDQPEAVPLLNYFLVGAADQPIRRIVAARDALFVLKDDGIFLVTGDGPFNFAVQPLDPTVRIVAPMTAVALSNAVWCVSNQGVVRVTTSGVEVMSRAIEDKFQSLVGLINNTTAYAWANETDRQYGVGIDTTQQYVYNLFTNTWTRWTLAAQSAFVGPDGLLYMGSSGANTVLRERKNRTWTDYADSAITVNLTSHSGKVLTVPSTSSLTAGDLVTSALGAAPSSIIASIDSATQLTLETEEAWVDGANALTVYTGINCAVQPAPITGGVPTTVKQYAEAVLVLRDSRFDQVITSYTTDQSSATALSVFKNVNTGGAWGGTSGQPWTATPVAAVARDGVPSGAARGAWLNALLSHRTAYAPFKLEAFAVSVAGQSERAGK